MDGRTLEYAVKYISESSALRRMTHVIADGEMNKINFDKTPLAFICHDS